jgi:hypothetical protein
MLGQVGRGMLSLRQVKLIVKQGKFKAFEDNFKEWNVIVFAICDEYVFL